MTTPNIDEIVARLEAQEVALGDARDVPLTERAQTDYWTRKRLIPQTIGHLRNAPAYLARWQAKLAEIEPSLATLQAALVEIERLIAEQPDHRLIADQRESRREWARQQDLLASRRALQRGVEYMGGVPCVPMALRKLVGVTVLPDGGEVPHWYGCIEDVESRIADLTARRDHAQQALDTWLAQAEQLLGATVSS